MNRQMVSVLLLMVLAPTASGHPVDMLGTDQVSVPSSTVDPALRWLMPDAEGGRIGLFPAPTPIPTDAEEQRGLFTFRCPDVATRWSFANDPQDTRLYQTCPIRIEDGDDFFGNLQIGVHPHNRNAIALFSQHGIPADEGEGPTERSRSYRPFTVFTSTDGGAEWTDQPIWQERGYSEMPAGVLDSDGNVYIAYLWTNRGQEPENWTSSLTAYKAGALWTVSDSYGNTETLADTREHDVQIGRIGMVRLPPYDASLDNTSLAVPEDQDETGDGPDAPDGSRRGEAANDEEATPERVLVAWAARLIRGEGPQGLERWIDAAWTDTASANRWEHLPRDQVVGPCLNASAPVAFEGKAYVACSVAKGYDARPRAHVGDVDVWEIDPWTRETRFVGFTRTNGETPHLATTPNGYMVAVAESWNGENPIEVEIAFGWYGSQWSRIPNDFGGLLNRHAGLGALRDAHVTGLAVSEREKTAFLVYSEWVKEADAAEDPNHAGASGASEDGEIRKLLVAFNECQFPVQAVRMQVGVGIGGVGYNATGNSFDLPGPRVGYPVGAYNDLQDGLIYLPGENGEELLYLAINDYGIAQFAEVLVHAPEQQCPWTPPNPAVPVLGAPVATGLSTASMTALGSSIGAVALAMVGYLLTIKRRTAQHTTAEDR